jgi:type I restriction enzyme, R subunit
VIGWRKKQQARASVQVAIEEGLTELPDGYDSALFQQKLGTVYQHIYEHYASAIQNTYAQAA